MDADVITFDFADGRIANATAIERIGMWFLRLGARISSSFDFVGYSIGAKLVRSVLPSRRNVRVRFAEDSVFEFPYGDGYYGRLLDNRESYSPGMEAFLKAQAQIPYAFIDCGANFGYMSVMVTSAAYGSKPAVAIEADEGNVAHLRLNAEINGQRFECHHNAIHSTSGEVLNLYGSKHEAFTVDPGAGGQVRGRVTTLALDDLVEWVDRQGGVPVVLKLDIEGVEVEAMAGASELLRRDCLIIYEEHGNDPANTVSHFLKDELGMALYHDVNGGPELAAIDDYDTIRKIKTNKRVGYDFFATRSPFWLDRIGAGAGDRQAA